MAPSSSARLKNSKFKFVALLSAILSIVLIDGCGFKEDKLYSKDEAETKFVQICRDEYNWDVNTKFIGNTFWIYLPYQKDIFRFEANRFAQTTRCAVGHVEGDFSDRRFYFEYEVMSLSKSPEDKGYTQNFVEEIHEDFNNLWNVIYRVYFNAEEQPEFFVIVMADIKNGVEMIQTMYNKDLKKGYDSIFSPDEFSKRILRDIKGSLAIINDKTGRHLTYGTTNLSQFLTKQIVQRIQFESVAINSKLCSAPEDEILKIISYCIRTYEFGDFSEATLKNLSSGSQITISRSDLEEIKEF
jgi:hypothetical protein